MDLKLVVVKDLSKVDRRAVLLAILMVVEMVAMTVDRKVGNSVETWAAERDMNSADAKADWSAVMTVAETAGKKAEKDNANDLIRIHRCRR